MDSPAAARVENTRNPPLFAVTFRRTRHLPVDECHSFVTKTRQAALALVQACFSAYQATAPQQDCSKVPLYFKVGYNYEIWIGKTIDYSLFRLMIMDRKIKRLIVKYGLYLHQIENER